MSKIKLDDIKLILEPEGWRVLSDSYTNLNTEMDFMCNEGHKVIATWNQLRNNLICPICNQNKFKKLEREIQPKKKDEYRILALDQATHISGWAAYNKDGLIRFGTFHTTKDTTPSRIHETKEWLINMCSIWQPDLIGFEDIQLQELEGGASVGVTTFKTLAHLQGVLIDCCEELNIPYQVVHTATWRNHCGVKGRTRQDKKTSMRLLAKKWYDVTITDDEADAIGIGKYFIDSNNPKPDIIEW